MRHSTEFDETPDCSRVDQNKEISVQADRSAEKLKESQPDLKLTTEMSMNPDGDEVTIKDAKQNLTIAKPFLSMTLNQKSTDTLSPSAFRSLLRHTRRDLTSGESRETMLPPVSVSSADKSGEGIF